MVVFSFGCFVLGGEVLPRYRDYSVNHRNWVVFIACYRDE